jgi:hypothetical protein
MARLKTGADGEVIVGLPDGGRVRLAPGSTLQLTDVGASGSTLSLSQGRLLGIALGAIAVVTTKGTVKANNGEFVVSSSEDASNLKVFHGDAALDLGNGKAPSYEGLTALQRQGDDVSPFAGLQSLRRNQASAPVFGGVQKGKGVRVRSTNDQESVGGIEDASPDQDIINPGPKPAPPVSTLPPVTPPPVTPPVTPPVAPPTTPPAAVGGGSALGPILGALALGGITFAVVNRDNDNEEDVIFGNQPAPSPSLP